MSLPGANHGRSVVVTASVRAGRDIAERARETAADLGVPFVDRNGRGLPAIAQAECTARILIVGEQQVTLFDAGADISYTFHPNMIPVRAFLWMRDARDLFIEAASLSVGQKVLDCTVGFGTEATLAALAVGESGSVIGLESVPELAALTRLGLRTFAMDQPQIAAAMRRVHVLCADYRTYIRGLNPGDFDVVAFDPFFPEQLSGAENAINPLAHFGDRSPLDIESALRASQIASRVVIKHPKYISLPAELKNAAFTVVSSRRSRLAYTVLAGT